MELNALFSGVALKGFKVKNRIVFPAMVCFGYTGDDGIVGPGNIEHYRKRAESGAGIVITEATAVKEDGRAANSQLGVWSDDHIAGLSELTSIVRSHGSVSLLQLHHAGLVTPPAVSPVQFCPSADPDKPSSRELTKDAIHEIITAFIKGAIRARESGFDGIELHGAHGYLLNQFANPLWNHRTDEYGGSFQNRLRFATEVIHGIRKECGNEFILGYRMGANTPSLEDGIKTAIYLESIGLDYIHVSHGGNLQNLPRPPKGFEYNWIVYSGVKVREQLKIPVIVVNEIKTAERANALIEGGLADFVSIGRPQLADPYWVKHIQNGENINACFSCKPRCRWYETSDLCPARKKLKQQQPD
ncbi:MAG: NADH:flavin oxidoreductase [Bacteroidetes bacterium]|nr:NADH:flavin oxidoreductase [Bacteroidota bacterium]